jgi:hypothetical protein
MVLFTWLNVTAFGRSAIIQFGARAVWIVGSWIVGAVFASRSNRLYWERQRRRIDDGLLHPYKLKPMERYQGSQRVWAWVGLFYLVLGYVTSVPLLRTAVPGRSPAVLIATGACDATMLMVIWGWERHRRRASRSPTPGPS